MTPLGRTVVLSLMGISLTLGACSESSSDSSASDASGASDTAPPADDGLDQLARDMGIEEDSDAADTSDSAGSQTDQDDDDQDGGGQDSSGGAESASDRGGGDADDDGGGSGGDEREWVKEREAQSVLGRTHERGQDIRDRMRGGAAPAGGIASTTEEDEYAAASGLRWEMPEGWRMAVPVGERFAEMFIESPLGGASVAFTRETSGVREIVRALEGRMVDPSGGRAGARTRRTTVLGNPVTIVDLEGTYLDPGAKGGRNERIFYAMHAAVFDLGDERVLITMWGPEDTVGLATPAFDAMIERTTQR